MSAPRVLDAITCIEAFAPLSAQASWDNSGLLFGNPNTPLTGILVTLDLTPAVAKEAAERGCNLVIAHHPSLFEPVHKFSSEDPQHVGFLLCVQKEIAVYAAHTSVDFAKGGLNEQFAKQLGCKSVFNIAGDPQLPLVGELDGEVTFDAFLNQCKLAFGKHAVRGYANGTKTIKTVACCCGGGGDTESILLAKGAGANVYVSGDFKYHALRFAFDASYAIIDVGHYESEIGFLGLISNILSNGGFLDFVKITQALQPVCQKE